MALVGSLGRSEEDNWSDIDLLILASDQFIRQFMNEPAASPWARADLLSDGRHNSPAGAASLGTTRIRSGLPLWVDLHVHPAGRTPWPTDSHVVFERRPVETGTLSFGEFNASGPRQPATAKTADEVRQIHLGYVPIAGKYVGRRSPRACEMIRFLWQRRDFNDHDPAAQIVALRGIAEGLSSPSSGQLGDAVAFYLDLVEATVKPGGEQGKLVQRRRAQRRHPDQVDSARLRTTPVLARGRTLPGHPGTYRARAAGELAAVEYAISPVGESSQHGRLCTRRAGPAARRYGRVHD